MPLSSSFMNSKYSFPVDSVLLLGPTGVGKSPLGDHIVRHGLFGRSALHLDFGAELRSIASRADTPSLFSRAELDFITGVFERGLVLENEHFPLAEKILSLHLDRAGYCSDSILVLNGIPRHAGQARGIDRISAIWALVVLDCTANTVYCRLRENVGGDRIGRMDDGEALVEKKLRIYHERTAPLIDHYAKTGRKIYRVNISVTTTVDDAYQKISFLTAGDPPVPFVAEPPKR